MSDFFSPTDAGEQVFDGDVVMTEPSETVFGTQLKCYGLSLRRKRRFLMSHNANLRLALQSSDHQDASGSRLKVDGAKSAILFFCALLLVQMADQNHGTPIPICDAAELGHD